jgi:hypothetical protein
MNVRLNRRSGLEPDGWCAATLLLCEGHEVELERRIERYPEQRAYLLWRPSDHALPFRRPDCWGLSVGRLENSLVEILDGAPVYLLEPHECLWSSWIDLILVSGECEPWLTELLQRSREHQRDAERARYLH